MNLLFGSSKQGKREANKQSKSAGAAPADGAPPSKRGVCPACNKGVYSDQVRTVQDGLYYHEACLTPSTKDKESPVSARKSTSTSAAKQSTASEAKVDESPRSQRASTKGTESPVSARKSTPASAAKQATASEATIKLSARAVDEAPRSQRGVCPVCEEGVYSDQVRTVQNGLYYHEACLTPSTKDKESPVSARKSTPASAAKRQTASDETIEKGLETKLSARDVDEAPRSQRGVCPVCEEGVYSDQVRTVQNGLYYHEACLTASTKVKESPVSARKSTPASAIKQPTASEATIKLSARDVDEAPRSQRGVCPVCEEGVYSDQVRTVQNGLYYHEACLTASTKVKESPVSTRKSTPASAINQPTASEATIKLSARDVDEAPRSQRGVCPVCEEGVYSDQVRTVQNGLYYHEACLTASTKVKESPVSARKSTPASAVKQPTASEAPPQYGAGPKTLMNVATIEKGPESKISVGAVDEAPRSQRGVCPLCEEGVYSDQARTVQNGLYYHEACLIASTKDKESPVSARKSTPASAAVTKQPTKQQTASEAMSPNALERTNQTTNTDVAHRGNCAICGKGVYSDQARANENGLNYHIECGEENKLLLEAIKTVPPDVLHLSRESSEPDFWYQQLRLLKKQSELLKPLALMTSAPSPQDTEDKTGTNPLWEMVIEEETTAQEEEQQDEEEQMLKQKLNVQRLLLQQHHQRTQQRQQKLENQRQEAAAAEAAVAATAARAAAMLAAEKAAALRNTLDDEKMRQENEGRNRETSSAPSYLLQCKPTEAAGATASTASLAAAAVAVAEAEEAARAATKVICGENRKKLEEALMTQRETSRQEEAKSIIRIAEAVKHEAVKQELVKQQEMSITEAARVEEARAEVQRVRAELMDAKRIIIELKEAKRISEAARLEEFEEGRTEVERARAAAEAKFRDILHAQAELQKHMDTLRFKDAALIRREDEVQVREEALLLLEQEDLCKKMAAAAAAAHAEEERRKEERNRKKEAEEMALKAAARSRKELEAIEQARGEVEEAYADAEAQYKEVLQQQERLASREKMLQSREEAVQDALKFVQEQTLLREQGRMEQTMLQEQARMTIEAEARTQRTTLHQMEEQMKQRVKHEEESRLQSLNEREMRLRRREQQMSLQEADLRERHRLLEEMTAKVAAQVAVQVATAIRNNAGADRSSAECKALDWLPSIEQETIIAVSRLSSYRSNAKLSKLEKDWMQDVSELLSMWLQTGEMFREQMSSKPSMQSPNQRNAAPNAELRSPRVSIGLLEEWYRELAVEQRKIKTTLTAVIEPLDETQPGQQKEDGEINTSEPLTSPKKMGEIFEFRNHSQLRQESFLRNYSQSGFIKNDLSSSVLEDFGPDEREAADAVADARVLEEYFNKCESLWGP